MPIAAELSNSLLCQSQIDHTAAVMKHMIDALGGDVFGGDAKKPIRVGRLFVNEDNHATVADFGKTLFNRSDRHCQLLLWRPD